MSENKSPNKDGHIEVDSNFFELLAERLTAKQQAQQQQEVDSATKSLAGVLTTFYTELRRGGVPRSLAFKLVNDMLLILLRR